MTKAIEVKDLIFRYHGQDRDILNGIDLTVQKGEVVAIVGLSGGGKSTLCYALKGIIPDMIAGRMKGSINLFGREINTLNRQEKVSTIGIVFQDPDSQLFSSTVEDELAFSLENMCVPREEMIMKMDKMLRMMGLEKYRYQNPSKLSGGEKQLVALGAVLILEPDVLIFDEAMSQIDAKGKQMIKGVIKKLKDRGKTIIMVDHELNNIDISDRILLLKDGKIHDYEGEI